MEKVPLIIIQSLENDFTGIKQYVENSYPSLVEHTTFTDSFDHGATLLPSTGAAIVITSDTFHDHSKASTKGCILPAEFKNIPKIGDSFAQAAKKLNPLIKVYTFSSLPPSKESAVDKHFQKVRKNFEILNEVFEALK